MRLVCPNCAAQYEVDDSAIPETGRDVQCANCGNTWFQNPAIPLRNAPEPDPAEDTQDEEAAGLDAPDAPSVVEIEDDVADDAEGTGEPDEDDEPEEGDESGPAERPKARPTDPSVLDILRREAEHETARRDAEGGTAADDEPADVPDEDADEEDSSDEDSLAFRARAARSRLTATRTERPDREREQRLHLSASEDDDEDESEAPEDGDDDELAPAPRRARAREPHPRDLPDVDELNSSLRSASDKDRCDQEQLVDIVEPRSRRGNKFGFYLAILIGLVLLAAYALEAQIVAALPEAAPYLETYTNIVDAARLRFAGAVAALIEAAQNLMAQYL